MKVDKQASYFELVATVVVTPPVGEPVVVELIDHAHTEHLDVSRTMLRDRIVRELDRRGLIFGCVVGGLVIRQELAGPASGLIGSDGEGNGCR